MQKPALLFLLLAAACVAAACAITSESFWIDELMSAYLITADSIADYKARTGNLSTSDIQMPLYMLYAYGWEKISGDSELALRISNVPWLLLGVYAFWRYFRNSPRLRFFSILILIVSPFTWYYLNELRPYAMQIGSSCVVLACGIRVILGWKRGAQLNAGDLWLAAFGIIAMAGCTMLSVPWTGAFALLIAFAIFKKGVLFPKSHLIAATAVVVLLLGGLGAYYLSTLSEGARAATYEGNPLLGFAFSAYELLGFAGLGPGRTELRQQGLGVFTVPQLAGITVLAVLLLIIGVRLLKNLDRRSHFSEKCVAWSLLLGPPLLFMVVLAFAKDFRVLGRHLAPLLPVIAAVLALGISRGRRTPFSSAVTVAFFALLLVSSLSLRFGQRHRKDDYREAARIVKEETEKRNNVLWVANLAAVPYYNLIETGMRSVGRGPTMLVFGKADVSTLPSKILVSKPDIHDPAGFHREFIEKNNYRLERKFPGFSVWTRW